MRADFFQMVKVVEAVHNAGFVWLDIKPEVCTFSTSEMSVVPL